MSEEKNRYWLVYAVSLGDFINRVQKFIDMGYSVSGNPIIIKKIFSTEYYQPMTLQTTCTKQS